MSSVHWRFLGHAPTITRGHTPMRRKPARFCRCFWISFILMALWWLMGAAGLAWRPKHAYTSAPHKHAPHRMCTTACISTPGLGRRRTPGLRAGCGGGLRGFENEAEGPSPKECSPSWEPTSLNTHPKGCNLSLPCAQAYVDPAELNFQMRQLED